MPTDYLQKLDKTIQSLETIFRARDASAEAEQNEAGWLRTYLKNVLETPESRFITSLYGVLLLKSYGNNNAAATMALPPLNQFGLFGIEREEQASANLRIDIFMNHVFTDEVVNHVILASDLMIKLNPVHDKIIQTTALVTKKYAALLKDQSSKLSFS